MRTSEKEILKPADGKEERTKRFQRQTKAAAKKNSNRRQKATPRQKPPLPRSVAAMHLQAINACRERRGLKPLKALPKQPHRATTA
jgi:hypothetical protein